MNYTISLRQQKFAILNFDTRFEERCMLGATIGRLAPSGPVLWGLVPHSAVKSRLVTSRLANIFGNDTMYGHDKNLKRAKTPEINQIYRINRVCSKRSVERRRRERASKCRAYQYRKKSCEGLCESLSEERRKNGTITGLSTLL